jgi:hypothetical protein
VHSAIINWAQEDDRSKLPHLVNLKKKEMHLAKFEDLEIRLNYPYLFCHQSGGLAGHRTQKEKLFTKGEKVD